jgi:GNAT superfamily N-acetyltransferase
LRIYAGPQDIDRWLAIRREAFAGEPIGVGDWSEADFRREFLAKPWWRPEAMWFADASNESVGTITLARRGVGAGSKPVMHWLAVVPQWRRRGIGRLLIATLEAAAWDTGEREIHLETHAAWASALSLYKSVGYA